MIALNASRPSGCHHLLVLWSWPSGSRTHVVVDVLGDDLPIQTRCLGTNVGHLTLDAKLRVLTHPGIRRRANYTTLLTLSKGITIDMLLRPSS